MKNSPNIVMRLRGIVHVIRSTTRERKIVQIVRRLQGIAHVKRLTTHKRTQVQIML